MGKDKLSGAELTASRAELEMVTALGSRAAKDPRDVLSAMVMAIDGSTDALQSGSLAGVLSSLASGANITQGDPIFGSTTPAFSESAQISAPQMMRSQGRYRANQLSVLAATTPALFYKMVLSRRQQCWKALSDQYLASRVFFVKLWFFLLMDVIR